ncbi:hypothetical protein PUMCH_005061 [Australozyma saopauloensis]|uniref:Prenyltransferase alpha-alpha toroid domain-containing protein n=1 Tax=Australozyma saopauloensis TaxID=291208 RepID=A0AAX4HH16_9ASCO|nr:hypothetical protein PUMCH_005061 [[Candida] saopauloensis]
MKLLIDKHARYFQLCLNSLPQKAQSEDSNKLALVYFNLYGLALIGKLDLEKCSGYVDYVYQHLIPLQDLLIQAFRSSNTFALDSSKNDYDLPNLSSTFFALAILLVLEEDFSSKIDRHKIMNFVSRCQVKDGLEKGAFRPVLDCNGNPYGESDLRLCYVAASIRTILGYDKLPASERVNDFDIAALEAFILDKVAIAGGLSSAACAEAHSGLTFCGIAALKQISREHFLSGANWIDSTIEWLAHRQVDYPDLLYKEDYEFYDSIDEGGFNGRPNKFADTCYSWWVMALMQMLCHDGLLFDLPRALEYLLGVTQHKLMGGFGKDGQAFPDPFHSFLGIASIALIHQNAPDLEFEGMESLQPVDVELVILKKLRDFIDQLWS